MLWAYIGPKQDDWDELLPMLEFAYHNNSVYSATGYTPFHLNYGRHPPTSLSRTLDIKSETPAVEDYIKKMREGSP